MLLNRQSADAIMAADPDIAVISVGSIEQHGPHLPVITDWKIAEALGDAVAERLNAFSIPALPISTCREHMGKKGSVWMSAATFMAMMTDIVLSLKEQGFQRVAILQCHGGIFAMNPIVRELNARYNPELMVAHIDVCSFFPFLYSEGILETDTELHAGECETSQMLYLLPESVDMDKAADFVPNAPRPYLSYSSIFRLSPSGVWGEPTKASAEKGRKIMERMTELTVGQINDAFAYMSAKKTFNYSNF